MNAKDIMIIGQAPGKMPFDDRAGDRLAALFQLQSRQELIDQCNIINLLEFWPGNASNGSSFPAEAAQIAANELKALKPIVVMCGRSVAATCGVTHSFFRPVVWRGGVAVVIPHPTSISSWWADVDNNKMAARFFEEILTKGMPTTKSKFSPEKFREAMDLRDVSQNILSAGIGRNPHTVGRWARGETTPDVDDFFAIVWFLAVDPTDLVV